MAKIEIESAFVEPWTKNAEQHPSWGMKTAEPHSKKREDGSGYDTVSRTFRTVKVSQASGIDLTQFAKGDRVQVWGREVTEVREHDGKKYYDLVVWADRVEPHQRSQQPPGLNGSAGTDPWATPPTNAPQATGWAAPGTSFGDPSAPF